MLLNGCYRAAGRSVTPRLKKFGIKVFLRLSEVYPNVIDARANREMFDAVKQLIPDAR